MVQHADGLTEQGHALTLAQVELLHLLVGEVGGDDVGHLEEARALCQLGDGEDQQGQHAAQDVSGEEEVQF